MEHEPPTKKKKRSMQALVLQFLPKDIWVEQIFPCLGPGHFAFVAGVCRNFKEFYLAYFSKINQEKLPDIKLAGWTLRKAIATDTFYSVAFSSIACTKYCGTHDNKLRHSHLVCPIAARDGRLDVLEWAHQERYPWGKKTCAAAARKGRLSILKWLRCQDPPCPWDEDTCESAVQGAHLEILQWLRGQDPPCPWNKSTCSTAAYNGNFIILKWLRCQDPPCPWGLSTCSGAAWSGSLDILRWARGQDPPCP